MSTKKKSQHNKGKPHLKEKVNVRRVYCNWGRTIAVGRMPCHNHKICKPLKVNQK